jgi:hypothetical protein
VVFVNTASPLARSCILKNQISKAADLLKKDLRDEDKELTVLSQKVALAIEKACFPTPCWLYEKPASLMEGENMEWDRQILFLSSDLPDKIQRKVKEQIEESILDRVRFAPEELLLKERNAFCLSDFYPVLIEENNSLKPSPEIFITTYVEGGHLKAKVERLSLSYIGKGVEVSCAPVNFLLHLNLLLSMKSKFSALAPCRSNIFS